MSLSSVKMSLSVAVTTQQQKGLQDLLERVSKVEKKVWRCSIEVDKSMRRARKDVESITPMLSSVAWKWVPEGYYNKTLRERADILGAHSIQQLCKSMLMENARASDNHDATNSKFYLVVVQYNATINTKKLESQVRGLRPINENRLPPSSFDFRVAKEEDNDKITGYTHNSVTPFGLLAKQVPVIIAKDICDVRPSFIWMGGGHVDLKLGVSVDEFVRATSAFVLDVSDPR